MKFRYQTITQFEADTETNKARMLKQFCKMLGTDTTLKKKPVKQLVSSIDTKTREF